MAKEKIVEMEEKIIDEVKHSWGSWKFWVLAILTIASSYLLGSSIKNTFNPDFFVSSPAEVVGDIVLPVIYFSLVVGLGATTAMFSSYFQMVTLAAISSTPLLFLFPLPFSLIIFVVYGLSFYFFLWSSHQETIERVRVNFERVLNRGLGIFLALVLLLIALGVGFLWSAEIQAKGFSLPERLVENTSGIVLDQLSNLTGNKINSESTILEAASAIYDQYSAPQLRKGFEGTGLSTAEIDKQLEAAKTEATQGLVDQFLSGVGVSQDGNRKVIDVLKEAVKTGLSKVEKQIGSYVAIGFAFVLFFVLETFAILFLWASLFIAYLTFVILKLIRFIRIEKVEKLAEIVKA